MSASHTPGRGTNSATHDHGGHPDSDESKPSRHRRRKDSKWEILTSLDPGTSYNIQPKKIDGFLLKRRKWPLKGWHKRFFILENGVLTYGKTAGDIRRGRTIGRIDVGLSVISAKTELFRIDIDDEEYIHHIKASDMETFALWLEQLQQHRFFQQNLFNNRGSTSGQDEIGSPVKMAKAFRLSPRNSLSRGGRIGMTSGSVNRSLVQDFSNLDDKMTQQLLAIQQQAVAVGLLAQKLEDEQNNCLSQQGSNMGTSKQKHFFGLRKKKSLSTTSGVGSSASRSSTLTSMTSQTSMISSQTDTLSSQHRGLTDSSPVGVTDSDLLSISGSLATLSGLSNSNPSLSSGTGASNSRPNSMPPAETKAATGAKIPAPVYYTGLNPMDASPALSNCCDELINAAQDLQSDVSNLIRSYTADRDRFKASLLDSQEFMAYMMGHSTLPGRSATIGGSSMGPIPGAATIGLGTLGQSGPPSLMVANLRHALAQALQQNSLMRQRLHRIHADSDIADLQMVSAPMETLPRGMNQSLSYSSSCMSTSQFFDAREYNSDMEGTDETSEEEGEAEEAERESVMTSDDDDDDAFKETSSTAISESGQERSNSIESAYNTPNDNGSPVTEQPTWNTGRRVKLPALEADTSGVNLWNLLCRNIGKDLSKISMPVTLNEPLSVLQRLCEELEYSDLLDKAAVASSRVERMSYMAAFVVSMYASCNARAGHKPFNPLLGETFECIRDDRGFRYLSEQVSHHPPVSVCHAEGKNWTWWQDFRVKTKFWGKSMEFQPEGFVNAQLKLPDGSFEIYRWNKITTCIHNLFSTADRWADLYGECLIDCRLSDGNTANSGTVMTCKLEFLKSASGYWSNGKRHEVQGTIIDNETGKSVQSIFGKCTEALYIGKAHSARCIWRPGALPDDHALYYGFSRFAIELNEILESERSLLPRTDTRFRPDQRYLEEGLINEAETTKLGLEQAQRERRTEMAELGEHHRARWFDRSEENQDPDHSLGDQQIWFYNNTYWKKRQNPGFAKLELLQLW